MAKPGYMDSGWGWVVVCGAFCNLFLLIGFAKSLGIIFVEMISVYQAQSSEVAVIFSLATAFSMFCAPFATALADVYSCRSVSIVGGLMMSAGLLISSLVYSLNAIIYSYGIVSGLGLGLCLTPAPVLVSRYFDQKRALANSLIFTGTGLGGLVMPAVVHLVLEAYGLHPSLMIFAGLVLHTVVFASLYRPIQYYAYVFEDAAPSPKLLPASVNKQLSNTNIKLIPERIEKLENSNLQRLKRERHCSSMQHISRNERLLNRSSSHQHDLHFNKTDFIAPPERFLSTLNLGAGSMSFQDLPTQLQPPLLETAYEKSMKSKSILSILRSACVRTDSRGNKIQLFDVHLFLLPPFVILTFANMGGFVGHHINMILPPHCVETLGWSKGRTATLLSIMGITDTLGRLWSGLISDRPFFCKRRVGLAGTYMFVLGICTACVPLAIDFWIVLVLNMIAQFCFGAFCAIGTVVLMDVVGVDRLSNAWGLSLFCEGISICTAPLLIGYLRDTTGEYIPSFYMLATSLLLSSTGFFFIQMKFMNKNITSKEKVQLKVVNEAGEEVFHELQ